MESGALGVVSGSLTPDNAGETLRAGVGDSQLAPHQA